MSGVPGIVTAALFVVLGLGMVCALARLVRGPSIADRVVAVDLIMTIGVALCAAYAWTTDEPVFLDVAIVIALTTFVGTVAFARFLEEKSKR